MSYYQLLELLKECARYVRCPHNPSIPQADCDRCQLTQRIYEAVDIDETETVRLD